MNHIPVLKSKLIMPEIPKNFFLTDRLQKLYAKMDSSRGIYVCAPAGYGKTTLTVSYLNQRIGVSSRICWYRLDPEDRSLPVFIAHLAEAVFPSQDAQFAESRAALQEYGDLDLQPRHAIAMICQEMWSYHNQSDCRNYIVLDDFHNVITSSEICDITQFMLENLPTSCTLIILSRANYKVFTDSCCLLW